MSDNKNGAIAVCFVGYETGGYSPDWIQHIGTIATSQVEEFLRIIATTPRDPNGCTYPGLVAEYNCSASVTRGEDAFKPKSERPTNRVKYGGLQISKAFWIGDNPAQDYIPRQYTHKPKQYNCPEDMARMCIRGLKSGQCIDPLMRKLAAMMYPEKYEGKGQR